jgi:uncharacterized protein
MMVSGLLLLLVALCSSILNGLSSVGGGIMFTLFLIYFYTSNGELSVPMQEISTLAMFFSIISTLTGTIYYYYKQLVNKKLIAYMGIGGFAGAIIGSLLANVMKSDALHFLFLLLTISAAISMFIKKKKTVNFRINLSIIWSSVIGFGIGILGGIFGIGLGFLILPVVMLIYRIPIKIAVGTSLSIGLMIVLGGIIGKIGTTYIEWVSIPYVLLGSFLGTLVGGIISMRLKSSMLQNIVAFLLVGIAIIQLYKVL